MASARSATRALRFRRARAARMVATLAGTLAIVGALTAGVASAQVTPSGGDFQSTPPSWTATALSGNLNTVSAAQASAGTNRFYRTQYTTPANVLGSSLANMAATEGITSPTFTWSGGSPQSLVASFDSGVQFNGLLGVDANAGIGMYLQNQTTNTETLLASRRLTQNSADFSTVSAPVSPSLLITGDSYRVQVRETFAPTVQAAGSTTIDLDNVNLTETPASAPLPAFTSGSASVMNVTSSSATASATIDPGSADTTVQVDYGTTTSYGVSSGAQTIPANSGATAVSIPLSGLSPSTTYHAQITATNTGGTTSSGDLTFTTPASPSPPPAPTIGSSGPQGAPGERAATVGATINDAGAGSTYYVQYGTTTSYTDSTSPQGDPSGVSGATPVTTDLTGLQPGTTYHARYVAASSGGTTLGSDFTFTTAAASPPTVGSASASTTSSDGTQETVSAVVDPGANDTQVSVSYGTSSSYGSMTSSVLVPAGSGSQTVSIPISGLQPGTTYHYTVTASNVDASVGTSDATFTPTVPPGPPVGPTSASAGPDEHSVTLASTIDTGGSGGSYVLQYGTTTGYGSATASQTLSATNGSQALSASVSGLAPGTTYHARFEAMVNGQPTSDGADFQFTTAPTSPPAITAGPTAGTSDSAGDQETISATVDPGSHDTQVSISYGTSGSYGSTSSASTVSAGGGPTSVSIPISGLTAGTQYHYSLTASNADGTVSSQDATFVPTASVSPAVVATSATSGPDETSVTLGASVDTRGSGGSYAVQYGTDTTYGSQTTSASLTATSGSQTLSASLPGLAPGTTYHARFVVMASGHPTSYGDDYVFTTDAPPSFTSTPTAATTDTDGSQETITATVDPGGQATTVSVAYGADSSYGSTSSSTTVSAGHTAQTVQIPVSGLTAGATYHYAVTAHNAAGSATTTDGTFSPTSQAGPTVGATSMPGGSGPSTATLDSSVDTGGHGGTYYLEYGTGTGYGSRSTSQALGATTGSQPLSASLSGLASGTTYHVRFVVLVDGSPVSYGHDFTFTTAGGAGAGAGSGGGAAAGSGGSGAGGGSGSGGGTGVTGTRPGSAPGAACVAVHVTAPARTLRMLSIPAGAQVTARHGLRVTLRRTVRTTGTPTFQMSGGRRTRIRGRGFTITRGQLRAGRTSTVRVLIPQRPRPVAVSLRIGATGCGVQLTSVATGRSLQLRLRLPLGARRIALALPRAMAAPTAITLTTSTGTRTLALTGQGGALRLRSRRGARGAGARAGVAGALRVTAHGASITVTGLDATTTGVSLRFPATRAKGRVAVRVDQRFGGSVSVRLRVGRHGAATVLR